MNILPHFDEHAQFVKESGRGGVKPKAKRSQTKSVKKIASSPPSHLLFGERWVLIQHGASEEALASLTKFFDTDEVKAACIAYETGKHGMHPHWQCYFQLAGQARMKRRIEQLLGHKQFHLELAKGTKEANVKYVYAVHKQHQIGWVRYSKGIKVPSNYCVEKRDNLLRLKHNMKSWQKMLLERFTSQADFRDILWIWEPKGNTGKTYFAKYLHYFHGAILTGGKGSDMKYAIARWKEITGNYPVIILIDLARSDNVTSEGYRIIEEMKNAIFFSGKYESGMVASVLPPHICVFANVPPVRAHMSEDRWKVYKLDAANDVLLQQLSDASEVTP